MALQSMTGFARHEGAHEQMRWAWELRSVNNRGLDVRIRVPSGFERYEPDFKRMLSEAFQRGNIQASLTITRDDARLQAVINEDVLTAVMRAAQQLSERVEASPPTLDGLLNIRGVLEIGEPEMAEGAIEAEYTACLAGLSVAVDALKTMRTAEGSRIGGFLAGQINDISALIVRADKDPSATSEGIAERLKSQVSALLNTGAELDKDRLYMEAALLAAKSDIREELDRLLAHVDACRNLLTDGGAIGRRLDFIAQEFNRESNTLCSKSNSAALTKIGLDLKVLVDQFREQVQNLE